jgi:hypothetical protein
LLLAAADSTIEQTIRLQTNQLRPSTANDEIGELLQERLRAAKAENRTPQRRRLRIGNDKPS